MPNITPPYTPNGSQQVASTPLPIGQSAHIISLPKSLSNVTQTTTLAATITNANTNGTTTLQTPQGNIILKFSTPLPVGTKIDLQIPTGNPPQSITLQAPSLTNAGSPTPKTSPTTMTTHHQAASYQPVKDSLGTLNQAVAQSGKAVQTQPLLINGQHVRLSALPPSLQTETAIAAQFKQTPLPTINQSITRLSVRNAIAGQLIGDTVSANTPAMPVLLRSTLFPQNISFHVSGDRTPRPIVQNTHQFSNTPVPTKSLNIPSHFFNQGGTGQMTQSPPSSVVKAPPPPHQDVRVASAIMQSHITPPPTPTVSLGNANASMSLFSLFSGQSMGISTGFITDAGNPILQMQTPTGQTQFVTLNYPASNIPAGTQVIFTPSGQPAHNTTSTTSQWSAMQNLVETMEQLLPVQQFQTMMNAMPQANNPQQFPAAALLFLAAAKGGDLSGWLGSRNIRALGNTPQGKNIMERLMNDLQSHATGGRSATPKDPPQVQSSPDWRGYTLPMGAGIGAGSDIHAATLWTKQTNDDDGNATTTNTSTRFFIDLNLSRMGDVQFDGLIHPTKKSLNLSFITERPLGQPMQTMLKSIWIKTLEGLGYNGSLILKNT